MTKNILDTILDEEEPVKKSSFVVDKKTDPEIKKENIEEINKKIEETEIKKTDFSLSKTDELLTSKITPVSDVAKDFDVTKKASARKEKIYKKRKPTRTEIARTLKEEKISKKKKLEDESKIEISLPPEPLWLSVSEAAKIGGVEQKTIRRAIQSEKIKFKIINDRYLIEFASMVKYLYSNTKLRNKFLSFGVGQYVEKWI